MGHAVIDEPATKVGIIDSYRPLPSILELIYIRSKHFELNVVVILYLFTRLEETGRLTMSYLSLCVQSEKF